MLKLIALGVLSGAFFSTTFIFNEVMSVAGGHWVWSASLRYAFMILFLTLIILYNGGLQQLRSVVALFFEHWTFWTVAGGIGFGGFYALICFSADFAPGWVIAATWQFTVVASLFVFMLFGRRFPLRIWLFSAIIFLGVVLVNMSNVEQFDLTLLLTGGLPVLIAAFCYPFGNQLVWEATNGENTKLPKIHSPLLSNVFNKVFLMTLGSIPLWIILVLITTPPLPSVEQIINSSLVALFSGVCATSIFLFTRNLAKTSSELAGVDATQASEVIFALGGSMLFLGGAVPGMTAFAGLILILVGLVFFIRYQHI
ncbi:MAG: hypothetical protein COA36_02010 [Desulfotalea sp.]|nr:MAG: hypothetical protein COA36_02010 [Desulfotalea sp.]